MRKFLSILLCLCLIASSFVIAPYTSAAAEDYYDSSANYFTYLPNTILGDATSKTPTLDTAEAHTPIDSSIKFKEMHGKVAAVKLNNIEVGKSYKLSLWYKGTADATIRPSSPSYDFFTSGIYSAGTVVGANGALSNAISSVADISFIADTDWRQLTITFTATSDDLYFATRIWCGYNLWLDDITLTQIEKEYDYKVYDYENGFFNASFPSSSIVSNASANIVSEETENPISGNSSYKYVWGATGVQWAFLTPKTAENQLIKGASYRVSGKYSVHQVNPAVISLNFGAAEALYKTHLADYSTAKVPLYENTYTAAQVYTFSGKITTVDAGYPAMHTYTNGDYTTDYILFDDL